MSITLEKMKATPAYFHLLTPDQLLEVIEDARTIIFDDTSDITVKKSAGARLYYARETQAAANK
jgi:hypothetical protein